MINIQYKKTIDTEGTLSIDVQLKNLLSDRQTAVVSYSLEGENREILDSGVLLYSDESFSYFWENFNSMDFLGKEIKKQKGLEVPTIDEEVVV